MTSPINVNLTAANAAALFGTNVFKSLPFSIATSEQKSTAVSPEVQKRYDALLMQRADANAMQTGGPFNMYTVMRDSAIQSVDKQITALKQEFEGLGSKPATGGTAQTAPAAQPIAGQTPTFSQVTTSTYSFTMEQRQDPVSQGLTLESGEGDGEGDGDFDGIDVSLGQYGQSKASPGQFGFELTFTTTNNTTSTTQAVTAPTTPTVPTAPTAPTPPTAIAAPAAKTPSLEEQAKGASGALAAYMHANGKNAVNVNDLYKIAKNADGKVPADVQKAATFMVEHAEVYKTIETNDVSGADGISGVNNFDKMAQGLITVKDATGSTTAAADADLAKGAKTASGTLAAYLGTKGGNIDPNMLYSLISDKSGKVPKEVQKAAAFMLDQSDIFKALETNDVAGVDGISGVGNLRNGAQGLIAFDTAVAKK